MDIDNIVYVNNLIAEYGCLLTKKQLDIVKDYFYLNNSLSEIAENYNITRQAVNDTIKKAITSLKKIEDKLHIVKSSNEILKLVDKAKLGDESALDKIKKILEE